MREDHEDLKVNADIEGFQQWRIGSLSMIWLFVMDRKGGKLKVSPTILWVPSWFCRAYVSCHIHHMPPSGGDPRSLSPDHKWVILFSELSNLSMESQIWENRRKSIRTDMFACKHAVLRRTYWATRMRAACIWNSKEKVGNHPWSTGDNVYKSGQPFHQNMAFPGAVHLQDNIILFEHIRAKLWAYEP